MYLIAAFYKFIRFHNPDAMRSALLAHAQSFKLTGTLLLAPEGINGTIAGEEAALRAFLRETKAHSEIGDFEHKESWAASPPFRRLKVRLKREIVSMGAPNIVQPDTVGEYVSPEEWNKLLDNPDVAVVDTRNDYEVAIGSFPGAINPETTAFRDFPAWADQEPQLQQAKAVAMYCTGGIRCEKSTAYLRSIGIKKVFHLEGGILKYLQLTPPEENRWEGHCFVFDDRVSVGSDLEPGPHAMCHGCRRPLTVSDKQSRAYIPGVSCPYCIADLDHERAARLAERHKQVMRAQARGETHLKRDYRDDDR
jgi:UPF0176 protein